MLRLLASLLVAVAGCNGSSQTPPARRAATPVLRLAVITDLRGYLEPCGCQSRPLGGIDRMAELLRDTQRDRIPTVFVAAGDTLFEPDSLEASQVQQETWKAETLVRILGEMRLAALAPGPSDFARGAPELGRITHDARFPLLAANARARGAPLGRSVLVSAGALRVGVVGVSDLSGVTGDAERGLTSDDAVSAARTEVERMRAQGADLVIVLSSGQRRLARSLAGRLPGADFVVQGGILDASPTLPDATEGSAVVLQGGKHGHGLMLVDVYLDETSQARPRSWRSVGAAARASRRAELDTRIRDLAGHVDQWARDPTVARSDLDEQRSRLETLRRERASLDRAEEVPRGVNAFAASWHELDPDAPRLPAIRALIDAYDRRVGEHNLAALANEHAPPVPPGGAGYVGSAACDECHHEAVLVWRHTPHGRAWRTLTELGKHTNLACVSCHLTGYRQPGGSTLVHHDDLTDVGCESCHGPGSLHSDDPRGAPLRREIPASVCLQCHQPEHSDEFDYETYRPRIMGPGHGRPMPGGRLVRGQRPFDGGVPDGGAPMGGARRDGASAHP